MEVVFAHPGCWRKYFPSISVRDVFFTANIEIKRFWTEVFPDKFVRKNTKRKNKISARIICDARGSLWFSALGLSNDKVNSIP